MTEKAVKGSGNGARSGAQTLVLLAAPLNVAILRALAEGSKQQAELRRETGMPALTTLRSQLKRLVRTQVIEKHRGNRFPGTLEYELGSTGRELLFVADLVEDWLAQAPGGPLSLRDRAGKAAIKALAEGWSTTMLRALAANPLSLTELDRIIVPLSYPSIERRLAALRLAGQVEASTGNGRGTPYEVTSWARRGAGPLAAAVQWERRHMPGRTPPLGRIDAEAVFLLTAPLLEIPAELSGTCRMAVELPGANGRRLAGVLAAVEEGRLVSCTSRLEGKADAWALGSSSGWLEALVNADVAGIEPGGDGRLVRALLDSLHRALFGPTHKEARPYRAARGAAS